MKQEEAPSKKRQALLHSVKEDKVVLQILVVVADVVLVAMTILLVEKMSVTIVALTIAVGRVAVRLDTMDLITTEVILEIVEAMVIWIIIKISPKILGHGWKR